MSPHSPCPPTTILHYHRLIWETTNQLSPSVHTDLRLHLEMGWEGRLGLSHTLHQVSWVPVPSHPTAHRTQMVSLCSHQELHFSVRK